MKMFKDVYFTTPPQLLAAWPGMGNVGLITVDYIRRKLGATPFAEIDMSSFFIPDSIIVKDGMAHFPEIPSSIFHFSRDPDLIIFESNAQVSGREGISIIQHILDLVSQFQVKRVFTSAAFAQSMSFQHPSEVLVACNNSSLLRVMTHYNVTPMAEGFIAGLNGLLLGVAASKSIEAACLLGTIPSYASSLSYPKASLELISVYERILATTFDTQELRDASNELDQQFAAIEERIKEFFPTMNQQDEEIAKLNEEEVPHYIMEKIERLFKDVKKDKSKAGHLKDELVRWNLFELYEKRFLDLFRDEDTQGKV